MKKKSLYENTTRTCLPGNRKMGCLSRYGLLLVGLSVSSVMWGGHARAQMIPGYNPEPHEQGSSSVQPRHAQQNTTSAGQRKEQTPVLPDRDGGYVRNPMPSKDAPKLQSPAPSNKVMSVDANHVDDQVKELISSSDERIKKISLGNERFPDQRANMTELERDLDYDHRLREMSYLQKLSENGIKLFNTTYDGKREWIDESQSGSQQQPSPVTSSYRGAQQAQDSNVSEKDRMQLEHERAEIEREKLADEKKRIEQSRKDAEEKAARHKRNIEEAKTKMKYSTPDPKVSMIYGTSSHTVADILVPYYGRVTGVSVGDTLPGDLPLTIMHIRENSITARDEKGRSHTLTLGDSVPKERPSLSKFMPEDDDGE